MTKGLVHQLLARSAEPYPEKQAMIFEGGTWTYREFMQRIQTFAIAMQRSGVQKGDRVIILLSDKQEMLAATYAAMAAGGIAAPCGEHLSWASFHYMIHDCNPRCIVTDARQKTVLPYLKARGEYKLILAEECPMDLFSDLEVSASKTGVSFPSIPGLSEKDGAMILYTSGTSGKKKGVLLSHENLVQATNNINSFMGIDAETREYIGVPLTHSFGFGRTRCVLFVGGTIVVSASLVNPVAIVKSMLNNHCNALSMVPAGLALFFSRFEHLLQRTGPQIKHMEIGSSPMVLDHKLKLLKLFPNARICMHYGLTEASRSTFIEFRGESSHLDTVGKPSPDCAIAILNERGDRCEDRIIGEIAIKGKHVMGGYWNDDALTRQHFTGDGWFKTGDYGYLDLQRYLHLLGRRDDIINMGGVKVSPLELEQSITGFYPEFEICVVGIPDPMEVLGQIPVLCYVASNGKRLSLTDHEDRLMHRLDRNKIPRFICRFDDFKKTENGKIVRWEVQRTVLKKMKERPEELVPAFSTKEELSEIDFKRTILKTSDDDVSLTGTGRL